VVKPQHYLDRLDVWRHCDWRAHFGSLPHFFALTSYIAAMPETFVRRKVTKKGDTQENHAPLATEVSSHTQNYRARVAEHRTVVALTIRNHEAERDSLRGALGSQRLHANEQHR
jgi:hypothetical protein